MICPNGTRFENDICSNTDRATVGIQGKLATTASGKISLITDKNTGSKKIAYDEPKVRGSADLALPLEMPPETGGGDDPPDDSLSIVNYINKLIEEISWGASDVGACLRQRSAMGKSYS